MSTAPAQRTPSRCAAHPGRPAVDLCPVCRRARCGADRADPLLEGGCTVCQDLGARREAARTHRAADNRERLLRGTLAANGAAIVMGYVVAQYVQAELFEYLAPAVLGLLCGFAATSAAGNPGQGVLAARVRLVTAVYALLGTAFGFVLEGTFGVFATSGDVLAPYVVAVAAAWLWATPPKRGPRARRPA